MVKRTKKMSDPELQFYKRVVRELREEIRRKDEVIKRMAVSLSFERGKYYEMIKKYRNFLNIKKTTQDSLFIEFEDIDVDEVSLDV